MNFNIEKIKKYKVLIAMLAVAIALAIFIAIGLSSSCKKYLVQKNELKQMLEAYEQLIKRQPYPDEKNLALLSSNIIEMAHQFNNLNDELRSGDMKSRQMSNTEFMRLLEHKLSILRSTMERKGIKLPEKYAFGFEKYAGGQLPPAEEVPRLMQQLIMIEKMCLLLTEANIKELLSVSREVFESGIETVSAKRGRGRGVNASQPPEEPPTQQSRGSTSLYTNETFKVAFRCTETSLLNFINKLAITPTFIRIKTVEVQNTKKDFNTQNTPLQKNDTAASTNIFFSRAIIIGKEDLEAKLEIDIYSFAPSFDEAEVMKMAGKPVQKK
jgi:hypothetical protein